MAAKSRFKDAKDANRRKENCPRPSRSSPRVCTSEQILFLDQVASVDDPGRHSAYELPPIAKHPGSLLLPPAPRRLRPHRPANDLPAL